MVLLMENDWIFNQYIVHLRLAGELRGAQGILYLWRRVYVDFVRKEHGR